MLTKLSVKHYKAFDEASVKIRPITILLGANSVGKSSIIQLLLMLQQTGRTGFKSYKSALKLYGGYVNLGDPQNLFRKRDISVPVSFTFEIKHKGLKEFITGEYFEAFQRLFAQIPLYFPLKGLSEIRDKPIKTKNEFARYIDTVVDLLLKASTKDAYKREIRWFMNQRYDLFIPQITKDTKKDLLEIFDFFETLSKKIKSDVFTISYDLKLNDANTFAVSKFEIVHNEICLFRVVHEESLQITSDLLSFDARDSEGLSKLFIRGNTIFNTFDVIDNDRNADISLRVSVMIHIINQFQNALKQQFSEDNLNYVSPLRAHPKRYYMLDKAKLNLTLDTLDGDAITEVLKDNKQVTKSVNTWLRNFGVEVDVQGFKEVIHHLVVKQNNIDLDITDVGFGISQILPVIIQGFLSSKKSTTIIEQPEIHLHPKMQADLADLFIAIVKNSNDKRLIIETHSEYLLKRLRRRISEGVISPDDVSICLFSPQTKEIGAEIENLEIKDKGFFEWPVEFYGGEILKDTVEFLKNQS